MPTLEVPIDIAVVKRSPDHVDRELQFREAHKPKLTASFLTPRRQQSLVDSATAQYLDSKADPRSFDRVKRDEREQRHSERDRHLSAMHALHAKAPAPINTMAETPSWKNLDGQRADWLHDTDRQIGPVARHVHAAAHPPSAITQRGEPGSYRFTS